MSVVAELRIRSPRLALADALGAVGDVELELVQEVGTDPYRPFMFIWASTPDRRRWEAAMAADESVDQIDRYTELGGRILYRMRITRSADLVTYPLWITLGADRLSARWRDGWWHTRFRFPDRDALTVCREWCEENDVRLELDRVTNERELAHGQAPVTPEQREVLEMALDLGYFDVPRSTSMADIADHLNVSSQAVSERLRRGHRRLVQEAMG